MYALTSSPNLSFYDRNSWGSHSTLSSLPAPMEVRIIDTKKFEIKPIEGGGVGYGLGRALRMGFDYLIPKISRLWETIIDIPQHALNPIPGASAKKVEQKKIIRQLPDKKGGCQEILIGNCLGTYDGNIGIPKENFSVLAGYFGVQVLHPSNPSFCLVDGYAVKGAQAYDLAFLNDNAFVAYGSSGLQIFPMYQPFLHPNGSFFTGDVATQISLSGNRAYLSSQQQDSGVAVVLRAFDIQTPQLPKQIGTYTIHDDHGMWSASALSGNYILLGGYRLTILDIKQPNPSFVSTINIGSNSIMDIKAQGNFCYFTSYGSDGSVFQIVDIEDPKNPIFLGNITNQKAEFGKLAVSGKYAYYVYVSPYVNPLVSYTAISIVNISNPLHPSEVDEYFIENARIVTGLAVANSTLYLSAAVSYQGGGTGSVQIVKILCS